MSSAYNVFIFNRNENNQKDVDELTKTFRLLRCNVKEVKNQRRVDLIRIVRSIVDTDFSVFKYIVIVILDNTNEEGVVWETSDKQEFRINGDLLFPIYENITLRNKIRFSIIQNNQTSTDRLSPRQGNYGDNPRMYAANDIRLYATSPEFELMKWDANNISPFIRILCEELREHFETKPIVDLLNTVVTKVTQSVGEPPCLEDNCIERCYLGYARPEN